MKYIVKPLYLKLYKNLNYKRDASMHEFNDYKRLNSLVE